jgi:hypothetical protein
MAARAPRRAWRLALLLPHPPLSLLYLLAIRSGRLPPLIVVAVGLALLPLLSLLLGFRHGTEEASEEQRRGDFLVTALAAVEILWALACIAIVNIAAVWRLS